MGTGNYYRDGAKTVIIELEEDEFAYRDLIETIVGALSSKWWRIEREYLDNNTRIIAKSKTHMITVHTDSYGNAFVSYSERYDLDLTKGLAESMVWRNAHALFRKLGEYFDLRQRRCAWTSAPYICPL